jgi:hypothetical protein
LGAGLGAGLGRAWGGIGAGLVRAWGSDGLNDCQVTTDLSRTGTGHLVSPQKNY